MNKFKGAINIDEQMIQEEEDHSDIDGEVDSMQQQPLPEEEEKELPVQKKK